MAISKDALYLGEEFVKASTGGSSGVTNLINLTNETLNKPGEPQKIAGYLAGTIADFGDLLKTGTKAFPLLSGASGLLLADIRETKGSGLPFPKLK